MDNVTIREYRPGDASYICYMQMELYHREYGFKPIFEHYLTYAVAEFLKDHDGGQIWVAEKYGRIVGSIAIVKTDERAALLRWFAVDSKFRGCGLGSRLLKTALDFADGMNYDTVALWTVEVLHAARHLYGKHGFVLTETVENREWVEDSILEEKWERHK